MFPEMPVLGEVTINTKVFSVHPQTMLFHNITLTKLSRLCRVNGLSAHDRRFTFAAHHAVVIFHI